MVSSLYGSTGLRIGGLASGIDTDSIVKELMQAHRIPLDRLNQQKQLLQWQQEDYREINTALRSFRDKVFTMKLQATYLAKTASSSNEAAVSAAAGSSAIPGIYTVTVTQLAEGVSKGSQSTLPDEADTDGTTKTLSEHLGITGDADNKIFLTLVGSEGTSPRLEFNTTTDTIYSVVSKINEANIGITASYDATLNRFFLTSTSTGASAKIKVTEDTGLLMADNIGDGAEGADRNKLRLKIQLNNDTYTGQDATFNFGDATGLTSAANTVTVNGLTLTLKQGGGAASTITVGNDTDAVYNSIVDFVNAYNDVIDKINNKLAETRYRDYPPLTGEQKDAMSEKEIEKWEEMARSGLLRNDPLLQGAVFSMRATMSAAVPGLTGAQGYDSLAEIGITTGSYYEKGKLYINETKLKDALQKDPEGVTQLFTKSADAYADKGIALRLYDDVNNAMTQISAQAGSDSAFTLLDNSFIGRRLREIDEDIMTMEDRLAGIEDRYWRQFTAMEQAIQQMNAQSAWLAQQFNTYGRT